MLQRILQQEQARYVVEDTGMIIEGTEQLIGTVADSLYMLLQVPRHMTSIDEHMRKITNTLTSYSFAEMPSNILYLSDNDLDIGSLWCAGQIVHDAQHMRHHDLFIDGKAEMVPQKEDERLCIEAQADCLEDLYILHGFVFNKELFIKEYMREEHWNKVPLSWHPS